MTKEINYIIRGYKEFRKKYFGEEKSIFKELKYGQKPKILVISCSDSRVDPSLLLNCQPGDLFVVRNVANLVPPCEQDNMHHGTSSALEFGVCDLGIKDIIILGHSGCGGMQALIQRDQMAKSRKFINKWVDIAKPSYDKTIEKYPDLSIEEQAEHCSCFSLINSLENLKTFPWISEKLSKGDLSIHAWRFDIKTGIIKSYNPKSDEFEEII